MRVILERHAENSKADWQQDERRQPQSMQSIFWFPQSSVSSGQLEGKPTVEIMSVYLGENYADPETESEVRISLWCESISAQFLRLLKKDGEEGVDHHEPTEREQLERSRKESDW